jgi:hypothetical protein
MSVPTAIVEPGTLARRIVELLVGPPTLFPNTVGLNKDFV